MFGNGFEQARILRSGPDGLIRVIPAGLLERARIDAGRGFGSGSHRAPSIGRSFTRRCWGCVATVPRCYFKTVASAWPIVANRRRAEIRTPTSMLADGRI